MAHRQSKVEPNESDLDAVNISLLADDKGNLTLHCESCSTVYHVSSRVANRGELNWYACPSRVHESHTFMKLAKWHPSGSHDIVKKSGKIAANALETSETASI